MFLSTIVYKMAYDHLDAEHGLDLMRLNCWELLKEFQNEWALKIIWVFFV